MSYYTGIKEGEIFIANTSKDLKGTKYDGLRYRLGDRALDIKGKPLPLPHRPIFLDKRDQAELERRWSAEISAARWGGIK